MVRKDKRFYQVVTTREQAEVLLLNWERKFKDGEEPSGSAAWFLTHWIQMHYEETRHIAFEAAVNFLMRAGLSFAALIEPGAIKPETVKDWNISLQAIKLKLISSRLIENKDICLAFLEIHRNASETINQRM